MATVLASIFSNNARVPLARASERLGRNLMGDGVRALSEAQLLGAVDGAIDEVGRAASLPRARVEALVPHAELVAQASRIAAAQAAALAAIRQFDFTVTPFSAPVQNQSASAHLVDLARHFARDRHISESLDSLGTEVARWEEMISASTARLAEDTSLEANWRRKRMLRALAAWGLVAIAGVGVVVVLLMLFRARAEKARKAEEAAKIALEKTRALLRVDDVIATTNACTPPDAAQADRDLASDEQKKRLDARKRRCADERQVKARRDRCDELAKNVETGGDIQASVDVPADAVDLLRRVATGAILPSDLAVASMPCEGTTAEPRLWAALAKSSSSAGSVWGRADAVSPKLVPLVSKGPYALTKAPQLSLSFHAETLAKRAVVGGAPDDAKHAKSLCDLKSALGMPLALGCQGLRGVAP
jgi:hypothetical protein